VAFNPTTGNPSIQERGMSKDEELRDILNETASDLARIQTNPRMWLSWLVYLLARLEDKSNTQSSGSRDAYTSMLAALQDEIRNRLKTGGWN
jgi:hypothetical protein